MTDSVPGSDAGRGRCPPGAAPSPAWTVERRGGGGTVPFARLVVVGRSPSAGRVVASGWFMSAVLLAVGRARSGCRVIGWRSAFDSCGPAAPRDPDEHGGQA